MRARRELLKATSCFRALVGCPPMVPAWYRLMM
jgi:hypothetical protein